MTGKPEVIESSVVLVPNALTVEVDRAKRTCVLSSPDSRRSFASANNRKEKHFDLNRVAQHKVEGVQWKRRAE